MADSKTWAKRRARWVKFKDEQTKKEARMADDKGQERSYELLTDDNEPLRPAAKLHWSITDPRVTHVITDWNHPRYGAQVMVTKVLPDLALAIVEYMQGGDRGQIAHLRTSQLTPLEAYGG